MTVAQQAARKYRMEGWSKVISERAETGKPVAQWCRENGVSQRVYYYRLRQVREYVAKAMLEPGCVSAGVRTTEREEFAEPRRANQTSLSAPVFAEVKLIEASAPPSSAKDIAPGRLHIEIAGIRISAEEGYPADKLAALLRELTR